MATILPSGEELKLTPNEILRYVNPDGLRQIMRQERLRWLLKPNKDANYYDNTRLFKYSSEMHNEGSYQRIEIRTYPDNGAYQGFAGVNIDSGLTGLPHNFDKWNNALTDKSLIKVVNRVAIGATAKIPNLIGYGIDSNGNYSNETDERTAAMVFDPYDGRPYILSNDEPSYVNNDKRTTPIPARAAARICDIPTQMTQLANDLAYISDTNYIHTDNNFTHSNRMMVDNLDDRTFVYPAIAKDANGNYITNHRVNLDGSITYHPGIFASIDELNKVDLLRQELAIKMNAFSPDIRRPINYYSFDGIWGNTPNNGEPQNPNNMESATPGVQPIPFKTNGKMYQWRYNRIDTIYYAKDVSINIVKGGEGYQVGDKLTYTFGDDSFVYEVTLVGASGQIQAGTYAKASADYFTDDPSTHGRGVSFVSVTGVGKNATLSIECEATSTSYATQIKNNLYAYVNVSNSQATELGSDWIDNHTPDTSGSVVTRSNENPGYTGINSGRGGPEPNPDWPSNNPVFYEHGGNKTAGDCIHLFHYVLETKEPIYADVEGVNVYIGKWVDMGPIGITNPADIKALFLTNPDTNNFNNYYKFMTDLMIDAFNRNPDSIYTNDPNAAAPMFIHVASTDPSSDKRFTQKRINNYTGEIEDVDITNKVLYINGATGAMFIYNQTDKYDPAFPGIYHKIGWMALAGATTK